MNSQPTASIHIAKSLKSQPHKPKLVKEYVCSNAENEKENKARKHNKELRQKTSLFSIKF